MSTMSFNPPQSSDSSSPDVVPTSTTSATSPPFPQRKNYSCVLCAQRKVKCDKAPGGCANCTKARVKCVYKPPPPPRRRKKGLREMDTTARLRLYEDALRRLGVDPEALEVDELSKLEGIRTTAKIGDMLEQARRGEPDNDRIGADEGVLFLEKGKSRYLENSMWTSIRADLHETRDVLDASSSEDEGASETDVVSTPGSSLNGASLLFGTSKSPASLRPLHPLPIQIFKIWQKYLENVHPIVKVFHMPSMQSIILDASGNLNELPRNVEAMLFSIYCASINTLNDAECLDIMGDTKAVISARFQTGVQHALLNANFLKSSDFMVLQAFVLFLAPLHKLDPRIMWIFSGIAARIGQRLGLHRDGESLGLPPFDTEIRRRLWWQIMFLEGSSEKLAGIGNQAFMGDTKRPSNLNDSDLFPSMTTLPKEHEGATEMILILVRCEVANFLRRTQLQRSNFNGFWNKLSTSTISVEVKDKAIDELDGILQTKFVQHCDPSRPEHIATTYMAKSVIAMMRFLAHGPEQYSPEVAAALPQSEKDMVFNITVQLIINQNQLYLMKELRGFQWHLNLHFQWKAFIHLVSELRHRTHGNEVDDAWKQVGLAFEFHPSFIVKEISTRALPVAVSRLTLRAWDAYIAARGIPAKGEPVFIQVLRRQQAKRNAPVHATTPSLIVDSPPPSQPGFSFEQNTFATLNASPAFPQADVALGDVHWDPSFSADLNGSLEPQLSFMDDSEQMDWSTWNDMLADFKEADSSFEAGVPAVRLRTQ